MNHADIPAWLETTRATANTQIRRWQGVDPSRLLEACDLVEELLARLQPAAPYVLAGDHGGPLIPAPAEGVDTGWRRVRHPDGCEYVFEGRKRAAGASFLLHDLLLEDLTGNAALSGRQVFPLPPEVTTLMSARDVLLGIRPSPPNMATMVLARFYTARPSDGVAALVEPLIRKVVELIPR